MKVLVIGSINIDCVVEVDRIPAPGETVSCLKSHTYFGGKGANQALAASKAGGDISMIGAVGDDVHGLRALENLGAHNVSVENMIRSSLPTGYAFISVDTHGENAIVVVEGANSQVTLEAIDQCREYIEQFDVLLLQQEIPVESITYIINVLKKESQILVLNPAPMKEHSAIDYRKIDIISPNQTELALLLGQKEERNLGALEAQAKALCAKGVKNVLLTLGGQGVMWVTHGRTRHYPAPAVNVLDTTGAGDCFNGYLAGMLASSKSMDEAIQIAMYAASMSVRALGAQTAVPSIDETYQFMKESGVNI